jgi:hypothetical protein
MPRRTHRGRREGRYSSRRRGMSPWTPSSSLPCISPCEWSNTTSTGGFPTPEIETRIHFAIPLSSFDSRLVLRPRCKGGLSRRVLDFERSRGFARVWRPARRRLALLLASIGGDRHDCGCGGSVDRRHSRDGAPVPAPDSEHRVATCSPRSTRDAVGRFVVSGQRFARRGHGRRLSSAQRNSDGLG